MIEGRAPSWAVLATVFDLPFYGFGLLNFPACPLLGPSYVGVPTANGR
jgi:hypothetical protein